MAGIRAIAILLTFIVVGGCRLLSGQTDLADVTDNKFRLGKSRLIHSATGKVAGYQLILCPELERALTEQDFQEKCVNPFTMSSRTAGNVPAVFLDLPANKLSNVIEAHVRQTRQSIQNEIQQTKDNLNKSKNDQKQATENLKQSVLILAELNGDGEGSIAMVQSELERLLPEAIEAYNLDEESLRSGSLDVKSFAVIEAISNARLRATSHYQDPNTRQTSRVCSCLNSPTTFNSSDRPCIEYHQDPIVCRYNHQLRNVTSGKRCFCLLRGGPQGTDPKHQRLFDPGEGVRCEQVTADDMRQCFTEEELYIQEHGRAIAATVSEIQRLQRELSSLEKKRQLNEQTQKSNQARIKELEDLIKTQSDKLNQVQSKPQDRETIVLARFNTNEIELSQVFGDVFSGGWQVVAPNVASVPGIVRELSKHFGLGLSCEIARQFPELRRSLNLGHCANVTTPGPSAALKGSSVLPKTGLYRNNSLGAIYFTAGEQEGQLTALEVTTASEGILQQLIGHFGQCQDGVCQSVSGDRNGVLGYHLVVRGTNQIDVYNSSGQRFIFTYSESELRTGVYRDVRYLNDPERKQEDPKNPYGNDYRIVVSRPFYFEIDLCGKSLAGTPLELHFNCAASSRCSVPNNNNHVITIKSLTEFQLNVNRELSYSYLGEIGQVDDDCSHE